MAGYDPLHIKAFETGLVQNRIDFILPNDAYPVLQNAFVWRERIKRKQGCQLLGRLRRVLTAQALGNADGAGNFTGNIRTIFSLETTAELEIGSVVVTDGTHTFTDNSLGVLVGVPSGSGTINYTTLAITVTGATAGAALTIAFNYFPGLPVMGLRTRELNNVNNEQMVAFDQKYAYVFNGGFMEFITGTTWTGNDSDFFWSTNYWVSAANNKLFWVTNFSGTLHDPIRYTDGSAWFNFGAGSVPLVGRTDVDGDFLNQSLALLPFRGRLVAFNTLEGPTLGNSTAFFQRVRWSSIGNPLIVDALDGGAAGAIGSWRDDVRGRGGFLDIPTSESIVSVGFVRDNCVIYCERSTWQLRYTGRSIAPFQIERVNSELGSGSTFSAVQFDTSLVGIGDKGVVECDSFKSNRIDVKIPDLVFYFQNDFNGPKRVHGIRDFQQRIAYWTYPFQPGDGPSARFPNRRLIYNYENDSWAIFNDSFTCFGTYQAPLGKRWEDFPPPDPVNTWEQQNYSWLVKPALFPSIMAGNQQGFVEYLGSNVDGTASNDITLTVTNITGSATVPLIINSPNHNLETNQVIEIIDIPISTPFSSLNGGILSVNVIDANNFNLFIFNPVDQQFNIPVFASVATYIGGGKILIRDNFNIISKKFNALDEGQQIQLGYLDVLLNATSAGAISLNVYLNYNDNSPVNILPENIDPSTQMPNPFFNSVVPTSANSLNTMQSTKYWQRIICPVRGQFITLEWTLSNAQMNGQEQASDVEIDAQILYLRNAGRLI